MEVNYCAALCCLIFMWSATNPYVVSILFRTDASVHGFLFAMSSCSFVRSSLMGFSLCLISLLFKWCLFLCKVFFLFRIHLIYYPTEVLLSWLHLSLFLFLAWDVGDAPRFDVFCFNIFTVTFWFCCCLFCCLCIAAVLLLLLLFNSVHSILKSMEFPIMIFGLLQVFFLIISWSWHRSSVVFKSIYPCASWVTDVVSFLLYYLCRRCVIRLSCTCWYKFPGFNKDGFCGAFKGCKVLILCLKCGCIYWDLVECVSLWLMAIFLGTKVATLIGIILFLFISALCNE